MERNALRLAPFALGFVLMSVAAVLAEDGNNADNSEKTHILTLGTSIELAPAYPGASHRRFSAMPSIDIRRMDEPQEFSPPDDSIDYGLIDIGNFSAGPVIGLRDGRSRQESSSLNGLYRIKSGFEVGAFAQYWIFPNQWRVRAEVRGALTNRTGLVYDLGSDVFAQVGDDWVLSIGPRLSFGDKTYMENYFGISQDESALNGRLPAFSAGSGLKSVGLTASASYQLSEDWTFQVYGRYDRLVGDARRSPITSMIGDKNQVTLGVGLTKAFKIDF